MQHSSTLKSPRNSLTPPSLLHTKKIFARTNFLQIHELLSEECNLHKPALVHHQIRCNRRKKFGAFPSLGVLQTTKKCVCCTHALCELTTPYRESETDAWKATSALKLESLNMALAIWHAAWTLPRQISFQFIVEEKKEKTSWVEREEILRQKDQQNWEVFLQDRQTWFFINLNKIVMKPKWLSCIRRSMT